jgi:glycerophosphoryl diester phosphodiesterase
MLIFGHGTEEADNRINSRESFLRVQELDVDGVELDIRLSRDGELLVIHDPKFLDGRSVAETASQDRPADIILLSEALDLCRGLLVNIEVKNYPSDPAFDETERIADRVVELLAERANTMVSKGPDTSPDAQSATVRDRVLVSCFGVGSLDRIRERGPDLDTAHLVLRRRPAEEVLATCVDHGHRVIHPYVSMVDETFMKAARDHDLKVNVWTNFDETDQTIETLFALEIDGVITGFPKRALRLRGASQN